MHAALDYGFMTDMRPSPGDSPTPAHYDRMFDVVRSAEELGYRTVWVSQQHGVDDGYMPAPLTVLSALARETSRIRLAPGIVLLTLGQPRRMAEEAGLVDVLSDGRLSLGVGAGHHPHEFAAYGRRLEDRAELMEQGLTFLRRALAGDAPDGLPLNVAPVQPHVPIVVGALVRSAIDRAVRLADGHFGFAFTDPDEELPAMWRDLIAPALERHGRGVDDFQLVCTALIWPSERFEADWREHVGPAVRYQYRRYAEWAGGSEADLPAFLRPEGDAWDMDEVRRRMLVGPPAEIAQRLAAIRRVYPFDEIVVQPTIPGIPPELSQRCLRTFATEVVPVVERAQHVRT